MKAYLDFLLSKGNLLNKFLTRRLIGLWVAFICLFQDRLILSTTTLVRDDLQRCHLSPEMYLVLFRFCLANGLSSTLGGRLCGKVDDEWLRKA